MNILLMLLGVLFTGVQLVFYILGIVCMIRYLCSRR